MAPFLSFLDGRFLAWLPDWLLAILLFAVIVMAGLAVQALVSRFFARRPESWHPFLRHAWTRTRRLVRFIIVVFAVTLVLPLVPLAAAVQDHMHTLFVALFVVQMGWIALVIANIAMDRYVLGLDLNQADNLLARKAVTQMRILRQAVNVLIILLTAGFALMSFSSVRQFGISLFASAGIAGIVAGMAARPLFENLLAGLQLAFTQPLRMGDAVVIAGEWGWVEEIGSVYIVVRLWDWRRLVVPLSYIFNTPFANWTRSSASIIGTVFLYMDYTLPVDKVREKAAEIAKASPLWDGQVVNVQVSDAKDSVIEVRILASAPDSSKAWDLRCEIREKLIAYIRDSFPECLPRTRWQDLSLPAEPPRPG